MNAFRRWLARRRHRRYLRWYRKNHIVMEKPLADARNWSADYMRSLKSGR